ncbi:response regulator [Cellulomonas triticagri]|uniref:response regulator n=1 Tax=Cellulomonas triticagri TaxID=2483352 RepID=UPI001F168BE5|nr:response regulator transcription factor [Cellulomonas triticagri]
MTGDLAARVLLVDDDPLVRAGLRLMLAGHPGLDVVGEADDGTALLDAVTTHRPDVVLLDVRMPGLDGVSALTALRAAHTDPPAVVMLTTFRADALVLSALRAGAAGFLLKHTPPEQIVAAVVAAAAGEPTVSPAVLGQLIDHVRLGADAAPTPAPDPLDGLTDRERDVALAVADGLSNSEIGARLYLSVGSVKAHLSSALTRLGLDNRVQLAIAAHESRRRA